MTGPAATRLLFLLVVVVSRQCKDLFFSTSAVGGRPFPVQTRIDEDSEEAQEEEEELVVLLEQGEEEEEEEEVDAGDKWLRMAMVDSRFDRFMKKSTKFLENVVHHAFTCCKLFFHAIPRGGQPKKLIPENLKFQNGLCDYFKYQDVCRIYVLDEKSPHPLRKTAGWRARMYFQCQSGSIRRDRPK